MEDKLPERLVGRNICHAIVSRFCLRLRSGECIAVWCTCRFLAQPITACLVCGPGEAVSVSPTI